jgi:hypothetical protein
MIYQGVEDSAACGLPFYYFAIEHDKELHTFSNVVYQLELLYYMAGIND